MSNFLHFSLDVAFHVLNQIIPELCIIQRKLDWCLEPFKPVSYVIGLSLECDSINWIELLKGICELDFTADAGFGFVNPVENVGGQHVAAHYCKIWRRLFFRWLFDKFFDFIDVFFDLASAEIAYRSTFSSGTSSSEIAEELYLL